LQHKVRDGPAGGEALAFRMSSGQVHRAADQLHAIAGQVHAPVARLGWLSYGGPARVALAVVLVAVAAAAAGAGLRLRVPKRLTSPARTPRTVMLVTWGMAIVAYLVCHSLYTLQLIRQHLTYPADPILPITVACAIALFFGIVHAGRSLSQKARLGSAFIGAIAPLMIFQFPFDLIVMTRLDPAAPDPALYRALFVATFLVECTTLALLSLCPLVRLSRTAFFAFALMLLIFGIWALSGFSQPTAPLPFALNAASKVVAFVVALSLFRTQRGQASTSEPTPTAADDALVPEAR
jgi:hypothetical protein